jgi:hypothetical protein
VTIDEDPSPTRKRPLQVILIACLFIAAGGVGLFYHLSAKQIEPWIVLVSVVRIAAIVGGIFLFQGKNWARWLLVTWLALHVAISAFHSFSECAAHLVLLLIVGYFLFTPPAAPFFARHSR